MAPTIRRLSAIAGREPASSAQTARRSTAPTLPADRSQAELCPDETAYTAVETTATGKLNGLALAEASAIGTPPRRIIGTVMTLPPTPRNLATTQKTIPTRQTDL